MIVCSDQRMLGECVRASVPFPAGVISSATAGTRDCMRDVGRSVDIDDPVILVKIPRLCRPGRSGTALHEAMAATGR